LINAAGGAGGWAPCCVLGVAVGGRGCVGVVRRAGRRGSVACALAQRAQPGAFRLVLTVFVF